MLTVLVLLGAACLALLVRDAWMLRHIPALDADAQPSGSPSVAVIIPARNEERSIALSAGGVLAQTYGPLRLTVIDDHSTDATAAVLARLQAHAEAERMQVLPSAPLPPEWKGKCWACWQGAQATASDWLLFLDADTKPQPRLVSAALAYAQQHQLDLLTLMPFMELGTFWERTIMPAFLSMIQAAFPLHKVNRPGSGVVLANGQFILVRRELYERADGHRAVYDQVLEDVELAQAIVRAGGRMRAVDGSAVLRVRMYTSGAEVREGLMKNAIAGLRNGGLRSTWAGMRQIIVALTPPLLLLAALWAQLRRWPARQRRRLWRVAGAVAGFAAWSWGDFVRRLYRLPRRYGLLFPLGLAAYMAISAMAAWRIWRGVGVQWKGRTYKK